MSAKGRGKGKTLHYTTGGKAKRHRSVIPEVEYGIKKTTLKKIALKGGLSEKSISQCGTKLFESSRNAVMEFLREAVGNALCYTVNDRRSTVNDKDVVFGLQRMGTHSSSL